MPKILWILSAFLLVLLNAFFVAAEFGMVKLRNTRIEMISETYGLTGKILAKIHSQLDAYLSACQLGITLASLGLGWIGEPAFVALFKPLFIQLGVKMTDLSELLIFFISFSLLSFLHIVIGELMPKSLAIRQSEAISILTALPLYFFYFLMYPAIWLLNGCSNFLLKLFGLSQVHHGEYLYSADEIRLILGSSHLHGDLSTQEVELMAHTLDFARLKVTEVMRSRDEMVAFNVNQPASEIIKQAADMRFSRYPIYEDYPQQIIGILHVKDLFSAYVQNDKLSNIKPLIRPFLKISHQSSAFNLLNKFREGMSHFAIVYSRTGSIIGFVTLDNILHVIIGRIKDEFHLTSEDWVVNKDGTLTVKGDCSIYSLEKAMDCEIQTQDETVKTIGGLILNKLGSIPKKDDEIEFSQFNAIIEEIKGARILKIKVIPKNSCKKVEDENQP